MATRVISTRLSLDGEQEFKKQLSGVNGELRNLKSEMTLCTEEFKGNANSMEALSAKSKILRQEVDQQKEKVRALERALKDSAEVYGENDSKTDKYRQSLNRAKADLIKMQRELDDTDRYMDEARTSTDQTAKSIDGFGKEVKAAGGELDDLQDLDFGSLLDGLKSLKGVAIGGAIATGVKEVSDSILELEESTREYRKIMGTLELSSREAGYSTQQTADAYDRLYAALGDTQTAATTVANLQAIGLGQQDLISIIDSCTGAWATYGDSIPIDSLAESVNETIKSSQVTGTFADVLNWGSQEGETFGVAMRESTEENEAWNQSVEDAKTAEDYFNLALGECQTETERADLVLQALSEQGLKAAGEKWRELNDDIVQANKSQADMEAAMGDLGEALAPVATDIRNFGVKSLQWLARELDKTAAAWKRAKWMFTGKKDPGYDPYAEYRDAPRYESAISSSAGGRNGYLDPATAEKYRQTTRAIEESSKAVSNLAEEAERSAGTHVAAHSKVKTAAEKQLDSFRTLTSELDHLRKTDQISDEAYYQKLKKYRDQYLKDDANLSEYRKVTEQLYKYDESLAEKEDKLWEQQTKRLSDELNDRLKAVDASEDKMAGQLAGYGSLFTVKDGRFALDDIEKQIDVIDRYEESLTKIKERGVSDGLLSEITGMKVTDAIHYSEKLLAMSEEDLSAYNDLWEEKQQRAKDVADQFYSDQIDAIGGEYNNKLGETLGALTDTAFDSGKDTVQGLIDGLSSKERDLYDKAKRMADAISGILVSAGMSQTGSIADGSHAGGLPYVPWDGYLAELHKGEAVLTAAEATALRTMAQSPAAARQAITAKELRSVTSAAVNALNVGGGTAGDLHIKLTMNGAQVAEAILPDFRRVSAAHPEVQND